VPIETERGIQRRRPSAKRGGPSARHNGDCASPRMGHAVRRGRDAARYAVRGEYRLGRAKRSAESAKRPGVNAMLAW
jgi:hypothetical protein